MLHAAQMITQPPESTTEALGTNATFSCRGIGSVLWQLNGTQVLDAGQVPNFVNEQVFVPLPRDNFSELIVTATRETNATFVIICAMIPFRGVETPVESGPVQLLVYGEYNVDAWKVFAYCLSLSSLTGQILSSPSFRWPDSLIPLFPILEKGDERVWPAKLVFIQYKVMTTMLQITVCDFNC